MRAMTLIDAHCHVSPADYPAAPSDDVRDRWPCMRCDDTGRPVMMVGDAAFRTLDARSWDVARRLDDMDRDGVALQVLSPMPELLSFWLPRDGAAVLCDWANHQIAEMIARAPARFRGLGAVPLQDPITAAARLPDLRRRFGLNGVEIGSNIAGVMLGDARFDPFWQAAQEENLAVFVHALHPIAAKPANADRAYTAHALFPVDVGMAASSLLMNGVVDRFPALRIGFSHGGGTLAAVLGRLEMGWGRTGGFGGKSPSSPRDAARRLFYDSNVYDCDYLSHLASRVVPGQVFVGTDYPYDIMQAAPADYIGGAGLDAAALDSMRFGAAEAFLGETGLTSRHLD
ncbi:MAG: amidohydrolase [Sphingomonas bacterium]|nr:amidohydrolase [Sphingomonas bacterium]